MHHLKVTARYGIQYTGYPRVLGCYSDSNMIVDANEIKAGVHVFTLGGSIVS
jgi:hypothetical protein